VQRIEKVLEDAGIPTLHGGHRHHGSVGLGDARGFDRRTR
jgi:hypothetical protein